MLTQTRSAARTTVAWQTMTGRRWISPDGLCLLAGIVILALAWARLAWGSVSLLVYQDASEQTYAWWQYSVTELQAGHFPLWDPYTFGGRSNVGEGQEGVFYPVFLLVAITGGHWAGSIAAINAFAFLHSIIGFAGAYLLARVLGMRELSSLGCGLVFALGSFFSSRVLAQLNIFDATAWVPLVVAGGILVARTRQLRWSVLSGAALAMSVLAGHPAPGMQAAMVLTMAVVFLCCVPVRPGEARLGVRRAFLTLTVAGTTAVALSAVQLIPTLEYQPLALRWIGADEPILASSQIPLDAVAHNPALDLRALPSAVLWGAQIPDGGLYIGVAALVCVALGAVFHRHAGRFFWIGMLVIGLILSLGVATPLFGVVSALPFVNQLREPVRYLLLAHLSFAVLAAFGLDVVWQARRFAPLALLLLAVASAQLGVGWAASLPSRAGYDAKSNREVGQYYSSVEADGVAQFLATQPGLFRIDLTDSPLPRNYGELLRIPTVGGYRATSPLKIQRLRERAGFLPPDRAPDLLGIRFLIASKPLQDVTRVGQAGSVGIYENPRALPLAWLVGEVSVAPSDADALDATAAAGFDPKRTAILTNPDHSLPRLTGVNGSADITDYQPSTVRITTRSIGSALLVTTQPDYPGWLASIDGQAADLLNVNYAFLGMVVPDGTHTIELEYRPFSVYFGAAISLLALIAVSIAWWRLR
jgi:hypothetical protein